VSAAHDEARAQRTIQAAMILTLDGLIDASVIQVGPGGLAYAAWTNSNGSKGLVVRQLAAGMCVAIDLESGKAIAVGDGLSGLAGAVVRHYLSRSTNG
jgi:hypothetical protein